MSRVKIGRSIFREAFTMFNRDKQAILLPLIGLGITVGVGAAVFVAWFALSILRVFSPAVSQITWIPAVVAAILLSIVTSITQGAVVWFANERFEGRSASVGSALKAAFGRFGSLAMFGLFNATVGTLLRQTRKDGGLLGGLIAMLGTLAWAAASYFVLPVIMFEGLGAFASVKRSTALVKSKWQGAARANVFAGVMFALAWFVALAAFVGGFAFFITQVEVSAAAAAAGAAVALGSLGLFLVIGLVQSTIMAYVRVALYRYAVGQKLGDFDATYLDQAFVAKKGLFA
jgi:hypothetical protein